MKHTLTCFCTKGICQADLRPISYELEYTIIITYQNIKYNPQEQNCHSESVENEDASP